MPEYVALLRGIGPANPNQRNENLRGVFEELGFEDVRTVISSGNVLFRSSSTDIPGMEATIEAAWPEKLGFKSTTIIRSISDLEEVVELDPFQGLEHSPESYLLVTFCRHPLELDVEVPHRLPGSPSELIAVTERELFTVSDMTVGGSADAMVWGEKQIGKEITSRSWLTVQRILKRAKGSRAQGPVDAG